MTVIVLSRRNLEVLQAKLDQPGSACTIVKPDGTIVQAEENDLHYGERIPGPMHPGTESVLLRNTLERVRELVGEGDVKGAMFVMDDALQAPPTVLNVYPVLIDIKDGWLDCIHVFGTAQDAADYMEWQTLHSGDYVQGNEMPVEGRWEPPHGHDGAGVCLIDPSARGVF